MPPSHRLVNKHRRAAAIFRYFSLSFPDTRTHRKRYCVSKKAQPQGHRICIDRALRGQSLSGAKGVSEKTLYSGAGFPYVETNNWQGNPKNCPNYSILLGQSRIGACFYSGMLRFSVHFCSFSWGRMSSIKDTCFFGLVDLIERGEQIGTEF